MEVLIKIVSIPQLLIGVALAFAATITVIVFHDAIATIVTAFATDWIPALLSIVGDLAKGLLTALQKA